MYRSPIRCDGVGRKCFSYARRGGDAVASQGNRRVTGKLVRASIVLACVGILLFALSAGNKSELQPGDTEALRRLQARVIEALAAQEANIIPINDYNADNFQEICLIHDYYDAYTTLSARRPDLELPRSGRPRIRDEEYALAFVGNGRAGFAFLPAGRALIAPENRCFSTDTALIPVTPGRQASSSLEVGRPPTLRLAPGRTP